METISKISVFVLFVSLVAVVIIFQLNVDPTFIPEGYSSRHPLVPGYSDLIFFFGTLLTVYSIHVTLAIYKIVIPLYTFVGLLGFLWGIAYYYSELLQHAIHIMDMSLGELMHTYLPVFLFSGAFSIDFHLFLKTLPQSLAVGIPISILTSCLCGALSIYLIDPEQHIAYGILFGVIISPIYAKCVTRLLTSQSARTKQISVLLETEALFAVVITVMISKLVKCYFRHVITRPHHFIALLIRFISLDLIMGYLMGIFWRYLIRKVYTNKTTLFVLVFIAPFLTDYLVYYFVSGSGALAIVVVGVMLGMERTLLTQDDETFLLDFWDILRYSFDVYVVLAFSMKCSARITPVIRWVDYANLVALYIIYYAVRFFSFLVFSPILKKLGNQMDSKNRTVCVWGGVKSSFSLFMVAKFDKKYLDNQLLQKFFYYAFGLYMLSLIINGTFVDSLLDFLGLKQISIARQMNMNNCIRHIFIRRERTIAVLKTDRYLADTKWPFVIKATTLTHPYQTQLEIDEDEQFQGYRFSYCADCQKEVLEEPTPEQLKDMTKEARLRVLKAKKMSYSRQYENGMVSKEGIAVLNHIIEFAMDSEDALVEMEHIRKRFLEKNFCLRFVRQQAEKIATKARKAKKKFRPPRTYWRRLCYHLVVTNQTFDKIMLAIIAINFVIIVVEVTHKPKQNSPFEYGLLAMKILFSLIYTVEFIIRILAYSWIRIWAHGCRLYFRSFWNITDFIALLATYVSVAYSIDSVVTKGKHKSTVWGIIILIGGFLRSIRLLRIFEYFYSDVIDYLDKQADAQMAFTYELGKSYVNGETEILNMLPYMIDNVNIREQVKTRIESDRILITKLLGIVQKERPWIAITVKTKQAIWTILNSMSEALHHLNTSGWVDEYENKRITSAMTALHKKVNAIKRIQPSPPKVIFKEVTWMAGDERVIEFLFENVTEKKFEPGEVVFAENDLADGIYIVVTGLFVINYTPNTEVLQKLQEFGLLPIVDYMTGSRYDESYADYIVSGNCIGELSTLTHRPYNCTVTSDAHSQVYAIKGDVLNSAMEFNMDPVNGLYCRIWKEASIRIAAPLLLATPAYQTLSPDQVKYALERAFVPNLKQFKIFTVTELIEDIVLIDGVIVDFNTRETYTAPCCIPRTVQKLILPTSSLMVLPIDIETKLLLIPEKNVDVYDVMAEAEEAGEIILTESATERLDQARRDRARRKRAQHRRGVALERSLRSQRSNDDLSLVSSLGSTPSQFASDHSISFLFREPKHSFASSFMVPVPEMQRLQSNIINERESKKKILPRKESSFKKSVQVESVNKKSIDPFSKQKSSVITTNSSQRKVSIFSVPKDLTEKSEEETNEKKEEEEEERSLQRSVSNSEIKLPSRSRSRFGRTTKQF